MLGTPAYMAPERLCNEPYDGRSDVYSVGIVMYQMLAGEVPFHATDFMALAMMQLKDEPKPLRDVVPGIPPALEALVMRAMTKYAAGRPTAQELAAELPRAILVKPSAPDRAKTVPAVPVPRPVRRPAPARPLPPVEPNAWGRFLKLFGRG